MTYAELLADNQRLRKRIIELEQENTKSSVVLSCNTLQYMKAPLAKVLQSLGSRGIDCIITIHKKSARDNDFTRPGTSPCRT